MRIEFVGFIGVMMVIFGIGYLLLIVGGVMSFIGCSNMPQWLSCTDSWMPEQVHDGFIWVFLMGAAMMLGGFSISVISAWIRSIHPVEQEQRYRNQ